MRILWIDVSYTPASGSNTGTGIAWLRQRVENMPIDQCATELIEHTWRAADNSASPGQRQQLLERIDRGIERIVIASVNRLDYPTELIELLQHICPEVPLALACDSWWDGWRRTGLKSRHHLSLPWYRWWDGWVDWLQGRTPQLYEPAPAEWCLLANASRARASTAELPFPRGLIVGNCRQTLAAWSLAAEAAGYSADCISEYAYQRRIQVTPTAESSSAVPRRICIGESSSAVPRRICIGDENFLDTIPTAERRAIFMPQWILWDDSCLDTKPTAERRATFTQPEDHEIDEFFEQLPTRVSTELSSKSSEQILGIVAVSLPRADWALRRCSTSGCELLAKPNSGQGLTRLLDHYFSA